MPSRPTRAESDDPVVLIAEQLKGELKALGEEVRRATKKNGNGGVYVPKWIASVASVIVATALIGLTATVLSMRSTLDTMKATQFTQTDAERMRRSIMDGLPKPDTQRRLGDHERRLDRLEQGGRQ